MKTIKTWLPTLIIALTIVIQSTILRKISILGVTPDISLILLIFFSNRIGSMKGQVSGFIAGFIEDLLSLSPLGFHAFIKTLLGFLFGLSKGKLFIDPVFMPLVLVAGATIFKHLAGALLGAVFITPDALVPVFGAKLWIEVGLNAVIGPFIFALLKLFKIFRRTDKEGF